jgi:hypothetical protein
MNKSFLFLLIGISAKTMFMLVNSKTPLRINLLRLIKKSGRHVFSHLITEVPYGPIKEGGQF